MKMPMINKIIKAMTLRSLALACALLLAGCDGGIFGTGGPDEIVPIESVAGAPTTDMSVAPEQTPTESVDGNTGGDTGGDDVGTTAGDTATTGGDLPPTEGDMQTDAGGQNSPALESNQFIGTDTGRFTNNSASGNNTAPLLTLVNTSSLNLNAFDTSVEPELVLFNAAGIAPGTQSAPAELTSNESSLIIVDNNNVGHALVTYDTFNAANASVTTLFAFQLDGQLTALALDTETTTSDPMLAKVRIVQINDLGNASVSAQMQLQSAGANPGGQNATLGPLSLNSPTTAYIEIAAGDYELADSENRFPNIAVSLNGANAYTVVLSGVGTENILVINDTVSNNQ